MLTQANAIADRIVAWRREFHAHPELGFQEQRTAARVAEVLASLGWQVRRGVGRTGVVADLGQMSPRIALRADMDALPLQETNPVPYASQVPGVMHACGHDAHTAILLGVAEMLAHADFPGSIRLLFQPSEEVSDAEGVSGAPRMIQDGALDGVDAVLALHMDAYTATGNIRIGSGPASGGVDSFRGRVIGHGGHGARPHEAVDPIYISAYVILALNGIVSRRIDPFEPAVISLGSLHGGQADNVIPDDVEITGTIRFLEPQVQEQLHAEIRRAFETARTLGGDYEVTFEIGSPPMINDAGIVTLIEQAAANVLGAEHVLPMLDHLGAEDFGSFSDLVPGAMFSLGALVEGDPRQHHNPRFDIDERSLPLGAAILAETALRYLSAAGFE